MSDADDLKEMKGRALLRHGMGAAKLTPVQAMPLMMLDLACHTLVGLEAQLAGSMQRPDLAEKVRGTIDYLQRTKHIEIANAASKIVVAQQVPTPPKVNGS